MESSESWANFEPEAPKVSKEKSITPTNAKPSSRETQIEKESPYSSDGKNDYKQREKEYHRRWPKPHTTHTSSSSRDVSPWDEDAPSTEDFRRRPRPSHHEPPHHHPNDRYARPPGPRRRINSCDEEFEEEYERRPLPYRGRMQKVPMHRSKEIMDSENANWHYPTAVEHWSDEENVDRPERTRPFDRNTHERSTYGPPYDKRDPKSLPHDRRDYKAYDKRSKYYRNRSEYEYDPYEMPPPVRKPPRPDFDDYEGCFERGSRENRSARDYYYDRDRKSFDSNESYDSGRVHRLGSGEIIGSLENTRGDRYIPNTRSLRRNQRSRGAVEDDDSEEEPTRKPLGETGSLQRPGTTGQRSKHIQLDDNVWGSGPGGKNWKRPSSATSGDRISGSGGLSGSDGERDKRFRKKGKASKGKDIELRSNFATIRYSQPPRKEFYEYHDEINDYSDEPSPRNISPRLQFPESAAYYARRKPSGNVRSSANIRSEEKDYDARRTHSRGQSNFKKSSSRDMYVDEPSAMFDDVEVAPKRYSNARRIEYNPEDSPVQPQANNKFNFDGFESDFNSSPKPPEPKKFEQPAKFSFETEFPSTSNVKSSNNQQKLRFNENVSVSKFDSNSSAQQMFEDDFLEWTPDAPTVGGNIQSSLKKTNSVFSRNENIKKSDSVNIFARKSDEDPFENDDFFNEEGKEDVRSNFANFDDNTI